LAEEGQLSECFVILGWNINTRDLTIALPMKKFKRWENDLRDIIEGFICLFGVDVGSFKSRCFCMSFDAVVPELNSSGSNFMGYLKQIEEN